MSSIPRLVEERRFDDAYAVSITSTVNTLVKRIVAAEEEQAKGLLRQAFEAGYDHATLSPALCPDFEGWLAQIKAAHGT